MTIASLGRPDGLVCEATRQVMAALEAARPGGSRFVGGCVRNTLMGRPVDDIDIATQLLPRQVIGALDGAGIRSVPTGIEHGTVTAICRGEPYEITTLRRDVETDGRRAVVAFSEDWAEDAARRDFRMNALYADGEGNLFDPVGGGIEDAAQGRVIFIGDADERLKEDYLRILRFFRFNAWYGAGIDEEGLAACTRQKGGLKQIAAERIWKELEKLLRAPDPAAVVEAMHHTGIFAIVLEGVSLSDPPPENLRWLSRLIEIEQAIGLQAPSSLVRLAAMLAPHPDLVPKLAAQLRMSNAESKRLRKMMEAANGAAFVGDEQLWRLACYLNGTDVAVDAALLMAARTGEDKGLSQFLEYAAQYQRDVFPLDGNDVRAAGYEGPAVGQKLAELEEHWKSSDFSLTKVQLLGMLSSPPR